MVASGGLVDVMGDDVKMSASTSSSRWSDLGVRAASGVVMIVVAVALIWIGGWPFKIMCLLLGLIILWEWWRIVSHGKHLVAWMTPGVIYAALPTWALIYLRTGDHGFTAIPAGDPRLTIVLSVIAVVIATDIGAYFAGRTFGGPKLAPRISPKKTWAGFFGGILAAIAVVALLQFALPKISSRFAHEESGVESISYALNAVLFSAPLSVISQAGDLFESWLKRKFGVKDSSQLIPGHGGVMDRLDGLIFAASFVALYIYFISA
jgi:phosphatidate cytidylyltransferase